LDSGMTSISGVAKSQHSTPTCRSESSITRLHQQDRMFQGLILGLQISLRDKPNSEKLSSTDAPRLRLTTRLEPNKCHQS
jgi:hypothetical protein